eukprot:m.79004 g.79004  ORF g.79004 m.79004 type:complete len:251 (-) comp9264_c0_seq2:7-759(-)
MFRASTILRGRRRDSGWLKGMINEIAESGDRPRNIAPRRWDDTRNLDKDVHPHVHAARNTPGRRALNPRKQFLAQRIKEAVVEPRVSIVAQYNGLNSRKWQDVRLAVQKQGYSVTVLPNMPTKRVLEGTPFANMAPLFWSTTCVVSGDDLANVKPLMKVLKQPAFAIVGAKVENQLLTLGQLEDAAKLPSLDVLRATLVSTISPTGPLQRLTSMLMAPAQKLHQNLEASQSDFVSALERHAKGGSDNDKN